MATMASPTRRRRLLLPGLLGLALVLWLLNLIPSSAAPEESATPLAATPAPAAAPAAPLLDRSEFRRKPLRIQDRLSAEPIDVEVRIRDGEAELETVQSGDVVDLSDLDPACSLAYTLGTAKLEHAAALSDCLRESPEQWVLSLPYYCRVELELQAQTLPPAGEKGQVLLCADPRGLPEPVLEDSRPGPFTLPDQNMCLEGLLQWKLRSGQLQPLLQAACSAESPEALTVAAAGTFVISVQFAKGDSGAAALELVPGKIVQVPVELRSRPLLQGRLLDWEGKPVPNEKVVLTVELDLADYDLRLTDPHGLMAYRQDGILTQSVKKTYVTDAAGAFQLRVPRGREYALYSYALGGYAFWSTMTSGVASSATMSVDLQLAQPSPDNSVAITVLGKDGLPLKDARIEIALAGDLPFFRQWPSDLHLDEQGSLSVPGLEPGMLVGLLIHHEDLARGVYAPKYPTVPADRRIEVRLPAESYLGYN